MTTPTCRLNLETGSVAFGYAPAAARQLQTEL